MQNIQIPKSNLNETQKIEIQKNMMIVGANGSGKSRLGSQIELLNPNSKRISAQRYLQLVEVVQKTDLQTATAQLKSQYKNKPPTQPQNDYQQVLISLFAEQSARNSNYVAQSKLATEKISVPLSIIDLVLSAWNFIFPHRMLKLEEDRVRASNESEEFSGTEMSDGEKVSLYLISQIMLADKDCIVIIDEPELHLHKALMVRLWNKLEELRSDCVFIYITHDLDFAVSKPSSKIIWTQSYKKNQWKWKEIDPDKVLPKNLYLEILGSRKPILFVEGDRGSLDFQIYQSYYENFTVIPRESCDKVIESVKGLKDNTDLHDKEVFGLIDKDFRPEKQITSLKSDNIFCLKVNKIENLFLIPEIIKTVCDYLLKSEAKEEIISKIIEIYEKNIDNIKFKAVKFRIQRLINEQFGIIKTEEAYKEFKKRIFEETDKEFSNVTLPINKDITEILAAYPHKGLVKQIQGIIELQGDGYQSLVLNFISSEKRSDLLNILKMHLPTIELKKE